LGVGIKPYYNSFTATVCYLEAKKEPYEHLIKDKKELLRLIDVDLLTNDMVEWIEDISHRNALCANWERKMVFRQRSYRNNI
jgi:hypothetical protein